MEEIKKLDIEAFDIYTWTEGKPKGQGDRRKPFVKVKELLFVHSFNIVDKFNTDDLYCF